MSGGRVYRPDGKKAEAAAHDNTDANAGILYPDLAADGTSHRMPGEDMLDHARRLYGRRLAVGKVDGVPARLSLTLSTGGERYDYYHVTLRFRRFGLLYLRYARQSFAHGFFVGNPDTARSKADGLFDEMVRLHALTERRPRWNVVKGEL